MGRVGANGGYRTLYIIGRGCSRGRGGGGCPRGGGAAAAAAPRRRRGCGAAPRWRHSRGGGCGSLPYGGLVAAGNIFRRFGHFRVFQFFKEVLMCFRRFGLFRVCF